MKKILLICLVAIFINNNLVGQSCLPGGITFNTQSQIDSFPINYPTCTEIIGDVMVSDSSAGVIVNLNGLSQIEKIHGFLQIENNSALTNLSGLENIDSIGGTFKILYNPVLSTLASLNSLTISGDLFITDNDALISLTGLESLTTLTGRLGIGGNLLIENFQGLSNLSSIESAVEFSGNDNLVNLTGLENITTVQSLLIQSNEALEDFSGLHNLETVDHYFTLANNHNLADFAGFESLTSVGTAFIMFSHNSLTSFSGLSSLESLDVFMLNDVDGITDLSGLEALTAIGSTEFSNCQNLQNLNAIENADLSTASIIRFQNNPSLSICGQSNICDYIMNGGNIDLINNAPGCNEVEEILEYCFANVDHTSFVGQLIADTDSDCMADSSELGISNWLAHVSYDQYSYAVSTDSQGYYWVPVLEGDWNLSLISPSSFWTPCFEDTLLQATAMNDTILVDFFMQPLGDCSFIDWAINMPTLRPCTTRTITVDYCNYGTEMAEDVLMALTLDSFLTFQGSSLPYTIDSIGNIIFEFDNVDIFECGQFTIDVFVDCDSLEIWDVQCIHAELLTEELCSPDNLWDGSIITANGYCENDSIYFELENIGTGNMINPAQFRVEIVIDDIVLLQDVDNYQLAVGETKLLNYPVDSMNVVGMRLEADQAEGYPVSTTTSVVVPNCENVLNNILLTILPSEDGNPYMESFCGIVSNSYDPNIKSALPVGVGSNHEIDKNWKLDYTVEFQNTGNDTAFLVVIKDTLSENLDLTSLRVGGGSHPFTWALNANRELVFTFENILLPDSTTNEPESHGFVNFSINPKTSLLPGDLIENRVGIYFDFNDPIITNTVSHTIRKPIVASSENLDWCAGESFMGEIIWESTSIQIVTEFLEYDSIHFVHLEVSPYSVDTVQLDVSIGDYFENILILGDTTFTQSYESEGVCDSLVMYTINGLTNNQEVISDFQRVSLFPNPTEGLLSIKNHVNGEAQNWTLSNHLGQVVWQQDLRPNESLATFSIKHLPTGVYWLEVKTERATKSWKVVKI